MKSFVVVLGAVLLLAAGTVAADEESEVEVGAGFTSSIFASYLSPHVSYVHKPGFVGFGGGIKAMVGVTQRDLYAAPYGRLELGKFYLGAGPLLIFAQPPGYVEVDSPLSVLVTVGWGFPLRAAGGNLVFNLGADASVTASPPVEGEDTGSIIGDIIQSIILSTFGVVANMTKIELGLAYSL